MNTSHAHFDEVILSVNIAEVGFCPAENNTSNGTEFIWLRTPIGTNATFRCPNNQSFSVTRACMACTGGGVWQTFDQQGCGVLTNQLDAILASSVSYSCCHRVLTLKYAIPEIVAT